MPDEDAAWAARPEPRDLPGDAPGTFVLPTAGPVSFDDDLDDDPDDDRSDAPAPAWRRGPAEPVTMPAPRTPAQRAHAERDPADLG
jgi:hypothetical protein